MVAIAFVELFVLLLWVVAAAVSAGQSGGPLLRTLTRIAWTTAIVLTLAGLALAVWFYTSFELTW